MCSISGGSKFDELATYIWEKSKDRGRDDEGKVHMGDYWIGNHRATPTTEEEYPSERQPVGKEVPIVFNGIISNAEELGILPGEADTSILPRILNFDSLSLFSESIQKQLVGSFAIAALKSDRIWLACNYKPIWIYENQDDFWFSSLESHFPDEVYPRKIPPYSVYDPISHITIPLNRKQYNKAVVIGSSGLDSTAVAAYACKIHGKENTTILHFNYGCQANDRERESIQNIAEYLGSNLEIHPIPSFGGSSLIDPNGDISAGISGAEFAHEWVPARNLVMLSLTVAWAEAKKHGHIYLGTNLEEAGAYPDNEEQFILDFSKLLWGAVQNGVKIDIHTPLGHLMKHEIIPFGMKYDTPFHLTWSCYRGGPFHCGQCGPCYMRKTAFERNGMVDPVF